MGFTIQNGGGTQVTLTDNEGNVTQDRLGGGILADISDPFIHYNKISNNGSVNSTTRFGGGGYITGVSEDWDFNQDNLRDYNPRCEVQEFRLPHNYYDGNDAQYGNSVANKYHEDEFDMSGSIFDVAN